MFKMLKQGLPLIWFLTYVLFYSSSTLAMLTPDIDYISGSPKPTLSLSEAFDSLSLEEDPFNWQVSKHYQKVIEALETPALTELNTRIQKIIDAIDSHRHFFAQYHQTLFHNIRSTILGWLQDNVLTWANFHERYRPVSAPSSDSEESGEDAWRSGFMRGYERDESYSSSEESESTPLNSEDEQEVAEQEFESWKSNTVFRLFGLDIEDTGSLEAEDFSPDHIHQFLTEYVEGGNYSWLVNEYVEGTNDTSHDFVMKYGSTIDVEADLFETIMGSFWFDYDWEEFDVRDANFLPNTYIRTLERFKSGNAAKKLKKSIEASFTQLLLYNAEDFEGHFQKLREDFNSYSKNKDWRNALVTWSVYAVYRKVFEQMKMTQKLEVSTTPKNTLASFNSEQYLAKRLKEALVRARKYYSKVYPHTDTKTVVYGAKNPKKRAELKLSLALSRLKSIGMTVESYRPVESKKQRKNVLVPALYFVASDRPHIKGGEHKRVFLKVDLPLPALSSRVITKDPMDGVFTGKRSGGLYFKKRAKEFYVNGQEWRGMPRGEANKLFSIAKDQELNHSERVWIELLSEESFVDEIVQSLRTKLSSYFPKGYEGAIKIYSVFTLLYSTNSVCPFCTPSLIALQNSYEPNGFMAMLSGKLNETGKKGLMLKTRGYSSSHRTQDPAKFRLNTIVTAATNFDSEAHDLTEKGQHNHTTIGKNKPPASHNPHARLIFPEDAIDLHAEPKSSEGKVDPIQGFFYEFVGKDIHLETPATFPHTGVVFSSGGTSWGSQVPSSILKKY